MKFKYFLVTLLIVLLPACGGESPPAAEETVEAAEATVEATEETAAEEETTETEEATEEAAETEEATGEATEEAAETEEATEEAEMELSPDLDFPEDEIVTTDSGLQYVVIEEGEGETAQTGNMVQVHYTGMLKNGEPFDSSQDRGEPIEFPLGVGQVIEGWDEGIGLMKIGDKYMLIIPSELGYGDQSNGLIPPNSTLYFEVELLDVQPGAPAHPTEVEEADYVETDTGLKYYDIEEGEGDSPEEGNLVTAHFTIWLSEGQLRDSSLFHGEPVTFPIGVGQVLPGWDEGMLTMNVGGKRQLVIPPDLAFGEQGFRNVIPPNTTLIIELELLEIQAGPPAEPTEVDEDDYVEAESGLKYYDIEEGEGDSPEEGQQVTVHYTGWLEEDGSMFDSSLSRDEPFTFELGAGAVIAGWDEGVATMQVGGKRQLVIPPDLGYGERGSGDAIPPNATLVFEVELLEIGEE